MKAGQRDYLITIERDSGTGENAFGEITEGWASYATAYAKVEFGNGQENREAGLEGADQSATFAVPAGPLLDAVTTKDRIVFRGGNWDITGVAYFNRDESRFTAVRRAA